MSHRIGLATTSALSLALLSGTAHASLESFFKENGARATNPPVAGASFVVDEDVKTTIGNFKSGLMLDSLSTYEFEGSGAAAYNAATGSGGPMTVVGNQRFCGVGEICPQSYQGRFNTTGLAATGKFSSGKWLETTLGQGDTGSFSMSFESAINGIGFFVTDAFDFSSVLSYEIFDSTGVEVENVGDGRTINVPTSGNGALFFFGLNSSTAFNKIVFTITQKSGDADMNDFIGFDSVITGKTGTTEPPALPEPASIALTGLALLGLGLTRRKRVAA